MTAVVRVFYLSNRQPSSALARYRPPDSASWLSLGGGALPTPDTSWLDNCRYLPGSQILIHPPPPPQRIAQTRHRAQNRELADSLKVAPRAACIMRRANIFCVVIFSNRTSLSNKYINN